jgi:hypothetical protein
MNFQVKNTVNARKRYQILRSEVNAYSPSAVEWNLNASKKTALVYRMRKLDVRGDQGLRAVCIFLNLVHRVRYRVRRIPRVVRKDSYTSIDLSRDRDLNGTKRRRSPQEKKTEQVISYS